MRIKALSLSLVVIFSVIMLQVGSFSAEAAVATVYIGGFPVTVDIENDGAIVVDPKIDGENFPYVFNKEQNIKKGDVIKEIDGLHVSSSRDIDSVLAANKNGHPVTVKVKRGDSYEITTVYPVKEECSGKYKLGFWLKDKISGLGTVTFICKNRVFAALGHSIIDNESNVKIECKTGSVFECKLTGIEKGVSGAPGRLKGRCVNCMYPKGEVIVNDDTGLYGKYTGDISGLGEYTTCGRDAVRVGGAQILTTVAGAPMLCDVEIVRTFKQNAPSEKSMVLKIVDARLMELTGGIVQGMSGSPIIQNGKLVGAVTHVFTNNPIMGYGIYSEWMVAKADTIAA